MQGREVDKISFFQRWSILSGSREALNLSRRPGICDTVKQKKLCAFFLPKVTVDCLLSIREVLGWMEVGRMGEEGGHYKSACCWWVQEVWADSRPLLFAAKFFALFVDSSSNSSAACPAVTTVRSGCRASLKLCPRPPNTPLNLATPLKRGLLPATAACHHKVALKHCFKLINQSWTLSKKTNKDKTN